MPPELMTTESIPFLDRPTYIYIIYIYTYIYIKITYIYILYIYYIYILYIYTIYIYTLKLKNHEKSQVQLNNRCFQSKPRVSKKTWFPIPGRPTADAILACSPRQRSLPDLFGAKWCEAVVLKWEI